MPPERHIHTPAHDQIKVRQRSQRACDPCRKRKIKCDATEPCAACVGYGYDCIYTHRPTTRKGMPTAEVASPNPSHQIAWQASSTTAAATPVQAAASNTSAASAPGSEPTRTLGEVRQKHDGGFMASESFVQESQSGGEPLLLYNLKTRFTSAHSAIAWPKSLGMSLGLPNPPRLQSFGWNPGTRPEQKFMPENNICNIISLDEMSRFADVYFNKVHPFFGIIGKDMFAAQATEFWVSRKRATDFEGVICGVIALGSYFSGPAPSAAEAQVVEQGRLLLDLSIAHPPVLLSVKHVQAWILRALYLRSTTRPHSSWMASCNAVHIAEALGLHRDIGETQMKRDMPHLINSLEEDLRRRTFWVAVSFNQFLASEYGRTRVQPDSIGCKPLRTQAGDLTAQMVAIMQSTPGPQRISGNTSELVTALSNLWVMPVEAPFLGLLRADASFCVFRMLRSSNTNLPEANVREMLDIIRCAMDAVKFLDTMQHPWWNIIGTPFHSVLVLLSIETTESFAMIPAALEALKNIVAVYDSHLSREALLTARALVQGARDRRGSELESLDRGLSLVGNMPQTPDVNALSGDNNFEWRMDSDVGLSDFLDFDNLWS